jgi:hypothetical protein
MPAELTPSHSTLSHTFALQGTGEQVKAAIQGSNILDAIAAKAGHGGPTPNFEFTLTIKW